jgi:hypothetical protein
MGPMDRRTLWRNRKASSEARSSSEVLALVVNLGWIARVAARVSCSGIGLKVKGGGSIELPDVVILLRRSNPSRSTEVNGLRLQKGQFQDVQCRCSR